VPITASQLRDNVCRILDEVIETGKPASIRYKGVILTIERPKQVTRLAKLKKRPGIFVGDVEDVIHIDWMEEWRREWGVSE